MEIKSSRGKIYTSAEEANKDYWKLSERIGDMNVLDSRLEQEKNYCNELYEIYCKLDNNQSLKTNEQQSKIEDTEKTKAFFDNFVAEQTENQSLQIAKAKDKISELESKIEKAKSAQQQQNNIAEVCKTVIDSKAYTALSPVIEAIAEKANKSAEKKNKKIKRSEKKIKKQRKKIKKLERNLKKAGLLKSFINSLKNSDQKQTAFIDGMKALQQDSLLSAESKLEKTTSKIDNIKTELQNPDITETDKIKLGTKVKKLESKRDKLVEKINNLTELDQSLNKLAKTELVDSRVEELANTTVETAEKSAMKASSLSEVIDDIVIATPTVVDKVLNEDKTQTKDNSVNLEKAEQPTEQKSEQTAKRVVIEHPVKRPVTQQEMEKLIDSGMPLTAVKKDNKLYAVFEKSDVEKVNKILSNEQKRGQTPKM